MKDYVKNLENAIQDLRKEMDEIKKKHPKYEYKSDNLKNDISGILQELQDSLLEKYGVPPSAVTPEVIQAHVFIVENTGWSKERVESDMKNITTIFNRLGVMFSLNIKYTFLLDDSEHEDLRDFIHSDYYQSSQGRDYFFDKDKMIFIYIFTESIRQSNDLAGLIPNTTTIVFTNRANNSTAAHETGHIMRLGDTNRVGDNLMDYGRSTNIDEIYLTQEQIRIANEYLQDR